MKNTDLGKIGKLLIQAKGKKEMVRLLQIVLTPQEILAISKRIDIIKMLGKGLPQREIANTLRVGIATVERGAQGMKNENWWKDFQTWRA